MSTSTKKNRTERVTVRFRESEYKLLEKRAKKANVSISDYIRENCLNTKEADRYVYCYMAGIAQEMCNHVKEKYADDEQMKGWSKELWKHLS